VKEVASALGVPVTTYREWEYGRKIVGEPYAALAQIFEISVYELITGEKISNEEIAINIKVIETALYKIKQQLFSMD
jgi:transcriptional regulator with XRE-family HTH domain